MGRAAVRVEHVSKRFRIYHERSRSLKSTVLDLGRSKHEEFWALRDVSFDVEQGETFGILGENGSGKSTLLKCLARILQPDDGSVTVNGTFGALLELGAGFHPDLSGRENVYLSGSILGLKRKEIDRRFDEIVTFAGLERFIDTPVRNYSSGMYVRLGFAVAINITPDVLFVDEVLAVGDENFQRKCFEKFADYRAEGRTVVVVSHSLAVMRNMCDRLAWIDEGRLRDLGDPGPIVEAYEAFSQPDRVVGRGEHKRWGSGEIKIDRAEVLDGDGRPTTELSTGDDMILRFHYVAEQRVDDPQLCLSIQSIGGTLVSGPGSRDVALATGTVQGEGFIDVRIPGNPLLPGAYEVVASLRDDRLMHIFDHVQNIVRFDIAPGEFHERSGVVTLRPEWSMHPVERGEES